ncbi:type I restriction-modification system subunit M N-terminal domain-containing protein [Escherichia coli]|nr:type I restriction-modification system subunit M N-terminal domain-containing protein [Escherichia coli]
MNNAEQLFLNELDNKFWKAADKLRANMDAANYKHVVLGLIFLKYVSDAFEARQQELTTLFRDVGKLPGSISGHGYIDFVIDDVAVEFAVRKPGAARSALSASVNSTEVKKLMKYDGKALLVLFDFSDTPYTEEQIESFRNWPSLGRGNHRKSAFNVAYFFVEKRSPLTPRKITRNIRIR